VTLVILKKCLKINWFSALQLYSAEARKKSQDGKYPTVTPFISEKLSHFNDDLNINSPLVHLSPDSSRKCVLFQRGTHFVSLLS
jgi:hypothetical protein